MAEDILSKTLITGAGGMVGSYVDFGFKTDQKDLDVTNLEQVMAIVKKYKPKAIIHLAALTDVDQCERDPNLAYLVNSIGAYHVALAAKSIGAKMVYISTAGVFDGKKKTPYTEKDKPNPMNFYGRSKYLGEVLVREVLDDYIIGRVCWMFGGGKSQDKKFLAKILAQAHKPEIKAVKDQYGSPTFGKDLVGAVKKLLEMDARGIFNLANSGVCSRYEYAREIVASAKLPIKVTPVQLSYFKSDAVRTTNEGLISKKKLTRPWQEAVREYIATEWQSL